MSLLIITPLLLFINILCYPWISAALALVPDDHQSLIKIFGSSVSQGPSKVQFLSGADDLDHPKLGSVNSTVFDWWYFDAVSFDRKSSFVIAFFTSAYTAFPFLALSDNVLPVFIWASFPNEKVKVLITHASTAIISGGKSGIVGKYMPIGMQWAGTADMSMYRVSINDPKLKIKGSFSLKSTAPPHYACGHATGGMDMQLMPKIGWANAVPDGNGEVDMIIEGSKLRFQGSVYHDKNWGAAPFHKISKTWYWGRSRVGPYSIVWFYVISTTDEKSVSAYVSMDGTIVHSSCSGVTVKPIMAGDSLPTGFRVKFSRTQQGNQHSVAELDVTVGLTVASTRTAYTRWIGEARGCVMGTCGLHGNAVFEQIVIGKG
ncbi:hypothetical protein FQN57_003123 [Myotisia sp. PD_48]|nr:hypothetical protein FQN57_003123 [Myotisia sp. PD_48]